MDFSVPPKSNVPAAWLQEGARLQQEGKMKAAAVLYEKILALEPDHADALQLLGLACKQQGNKEQAAVLMRRSLEIHPRQSHVWQNLGSLHWEAGQDEAAYLAYRQAVMLAPKDSAAHRKFAAACQRTCRYAEAEAALLVTLQLCADKGEIWRALGTVRKKAGKAAQALAAYTQATAEAPGNAPGWMELGNMRAAMGETGEAYAAYAKALELAPDFAQCHRRLAELRRYTAPDDAHIRQMETLLTRNAHPRTRIALLFALAKALDEVGESEKAWTYLEEGNRLKRAEYTYSSEEMAAWFAAIMATFSKETLHFPVGKAMEWPVFIVGMPRSGTSLVEQILASHPQVRGAGERDELAVFVQRFLPHFPEMTADTPPRLAEAYCRALQPLVLAGTLRITDKMPGNFRFIGLIHLAFPGARIIHCRRNALDNCVSIYRRCFDGAHPYAYDQRELGQYYRLYEKLMAHWRETLPTGVMLEVDYESLVADPEQQTRRMLDFCGLKWDDACRAFHETRRPVHTASAVQVRQPVYGHAVGGAGKDAVFVKALREALGEGKE